MKKIKILTPVSHLFDSLAPEVSEIISISDSFEARERTCELSIRNTTHYHIDFDINLGLNDKQCEFLKRYVATRDEISTVTFQASRDCIDVKLVNGAYVPNSRVISFDEQTENTKLSLWRIQDIIGSHRIIGFENNNYYPTGAYNICTSAEFISEVLDSTSFTFLLDVAHAQVTCFNSNTSEDEYLSSLLSSNKCIQMHLCKPSFYYDQSKAIAFDAHELPSPDDTSKAIALCERYSIEFLTIEYYKSAESLIGYLRYLQETLNIRTLSQ